MKKKLVSLLLVAAMGVSMLVGCGGGDTATGGDTQTNGDAQTGNDAQAGGDTAATDITLTVWCPQNQIDSGLMDEQQKAFAEAHPEWNITWKTAPVGEDVAKDEILKDVEAAADVFFFANDQVQDLVNAGAIARLGGETETMVNETIASSVVNTVKVGDALYGIPFTHNTFFMYYDKSLLTEEDVKSLDTIIAKETSAKYNFNFDSAGGWKLGAWYYAAGLTVFGELGDDLSAGCDWNSEKGIAVTNYLIDMLNNPKVGNGLVCEEEAAKHNLGAWFDGSWNYDKYAEALGEDLGIATIPTYTLDGEELQLKGFYGSKAIGVNAKSKNIQAAVAFAAYLGSEEQQIARFEKSAQIPTNINAGKTEAVQNDALAAVIVEESNNCSVAQPTAAEFSSRYWTYADTIPTNIKTGELTSSNVQKFMDDLVESMIAE